MRPFTIDHRPIYLYYVNIKIKKNPYTKHSFLVSLFELLQDVTFSWFHAACLSLPSKNIREPEIF